MNHADIRLVLAGGLVETLALNKFPHSPYPYQREMLESAIRWLRNPNGSRWADTEQATGLGKTFEFAIIVRACRGLRVLVIEPGKTLIEQTVRELAAFTEGTIAHASSLKTVADLAGEPIAVHWKGQQHDVLVTTDETFKVQYELIKRELDPHVIIWDESHWSYTEKAQRALAAFPEAVVFGFTATGDYLTTTAKPTYIPVTLDNGQVLYCPPDKSARTYFPERLDQRGVRWGIQNNFLAPLAWGQLAFELNLEDVPVVEGVGGMDFDQAELQRIMRDNWDFVIQTVRNLFATGQYELAKRYVAAICPGVDQANSIAEALRGDGIYAASITAKTKDAERSRILQQGLEGRLQFLSSVFALREGWNSPNAEVAMMLRPTKSRVLYMQFMGRVLRLYGKKVALVLDPHYQNTRFAPLSAPVLFGTPGQVVYDGDLLIAPRCRGGKRVVSPYLLKKLQPVLTVEKIETEYCAGENGILEQLGETWISLQALNRMIPASEPTIQSRIGSCRQLKGKSFSGAPRTFYAISDVKVVFADFLADVPRANKDGTFEADGETWGTITALARIISVSPATLKVRIGSCRSREGIVHGLSSTFYALSDMRKACAKLLEAPQEAGKDGVKEKPHQKFPTVREDGTFEADGETWGTIRALARIISVAEATVRVRISLCREFQGKFHKFYALSDMRKACAKLLEAPQEAGKDGTFEADGETWGTAGALSHLLPVSRMTIESRARAAQCRQRGGRSVQGKPATFYALSDIQKVCADLLRKKGKK